MAGSLATLVFGLHQALNGYVDHSRVYLHPLVLGHGKPYLAGVRPPLRLMADDRIGEDVIRLVDVPV